MRVAHKLDELVFGDGKQEREPIALVFNHIVDLELWNLEVFVSDFANVGQLLLVLARQCSCGVLFLDELDVVRVIELEAE